jgi:hypothetical protein
VSATMEKALLVKMSRAGIGRVLLLSV